MSQPDFADVAVKPPLLFLGAVVAGLLLSLALPIGPGLGSANELAVASFAHDYGWRPREPASRLPEDGDQPPQSRPVRL